MLLPEEQGIERYWVGQNRFHEITHHLFNKLEYYDFFPYIKWRYTYSRKFAKFSEIWSKRVIKKQASLSKGDRLGVGGWEGDLRWKCYEMGCGDHCTTVNVINFIELKIQVTM